MLDSAVRRLRGQPSAEPSRADVQLELTAFIPNAYVPTESQRISLYRQLRRAATTDAVEAVVGEIVDMYGPLPVEIRRLVDLEEVRVAAGRAGVRSIHRKGADLHFALEDVSILGPMFAGQVDREVRDAGVVRVLDPHTVVWRLRSDPGPAGALALLKKVLATPVAAK
jgi:transcription-repair coupling factor (superfamily II helicase)